MAWDANVHADQVNTTDLAAGQQTYYDKTFLAQASQNLHMFQFAEKRPLPKNQGATISFYRYNPLSTQTTALTEGTNPAPVAMDDHTVTRTIREWGEWSQYSSYVKDTTIDKGLTEMAKLFGNQAGRSIDLRIMKEVVTCGSHSMSVSADASTSGAGLRYGQWAGSIDGTTASTATLIYANTATSGATGSLIFDDSDNWFIGGQITFLTGQNRGQSRYVYDSDASHFLCNVYPSFEFAPAADDEFLFTHPGLKDADAGSVDAMDASDINTHLSFAMAREDLQTYDTPEYGGGYYVFVLGPTTNRGFMSDTDGGWMGLSQYRGKAMFKGEIGKYMGFRVVNTSRPFRCALPVHVTTGGPGVSSDSYEATGSNYSATGAGHYSLAFGKGAFAVTTFPGNNTPKMLFKGLGSAGAADALNMMGSVGWKLPFVPCATNALWCVSVVSGG